MLGLFHPLYILYKPAVMLRNVLFLFLKAKDYGGLVVFCIFFGMSYGMVGALQFEVLMALVGTEKFSSAIGLVLLMEAMAVLVGPPGAGQSIKEAMNVNACSHHITIGVICRAHKICNMQICKCLSWNLLISHYDLMFASI